MSFSRTSSYPECRNCPARATDDCPAYYRITEHCPHYDKVTRMLQERQKKQEEYEDEDDLWENNEYCPECGRKADPDIVSCETGLAYCSNGCAIKHVNEVYQEEENQ